MRASFVAQGSDPRAWRKTDLRKGHLGRLVRLSPEEANATPVVMPSELKPLLSGHAQEIIDQADNTTLCRLKRPSESL